MVRFSANLARDWRLQQRMCRRRCACPECVVGWDVDDVRLDDDGAHSGAGVEVGDRAVVGVAMGTANHAETEDVALVVEDMRRSRGPRGRSRHCRRRG